MWVFAKGGRPQESPSQDVGHILLVGQEFGGLIRSAGKGETIDRRPPDLRVKTSIGVQADKKVGAIFSRYPHPLLEGNEIIPFPCQKSLHLFLLIEEMNRLFPHLQYNILLQCFAGPHGSGVFSSMTRIDDDDLCAFRSDLLLFLPFLLILFLLSHIDEIDDEAMGLAKVGLQREDLRLERRLLIEHQSSLSLSEISQADFEKIFILNL